jgi:RNA-directed DNA polymerase
MNEAKPFCISKKEVWEAYKRVKENKGAAGVDDQTIEDFEDEHSRTGFRIFGVGQRSAERLNPLARTVGIWLGWHNGSVGSTYPHGPSSNSFTMLSHSASSDSRQTGLPARLYQ